MSKKIFISAVLVLVLAGLVFVALRTSGRRSVLVTPPAPGETGTAAPAPSAATGSPSTPSAGSPVTSPGSPSGTATVTATTTPIVPPTGFPTITISYFDPTTLNAKAFSHQMADYDAQHDQVIFYPYGSTSPPATSGILLTYHPDGAFTSPSSWTTVDLTQVVSPSAYNFGGGFLDASGQYAYLPAAGTAHPGSAPAMQIDLAKESANPDDPSAYRVFYPKDLAGIPAVGSFAGVFGNGYAYFSPTTVTATAGAPASVLIRYNESLSFTASTAWQWYNLGDLGGMQSAAFVSPNVYLIPFAGATSTASKLVVYDTNDDFNSPSSYQTFDLSTLPFPANIRAQLNGFTGGVVVGKYLVFVPWGLQKKATNAVTLAYDTTQPLSSPSAWQYLDLTTVNPSAGGYQFGWLDKDGYVWFVPTHNYNISSPKVPPFVVWNSHLPFNAASSWKSYPDNPSFSTWCTGAAYDPNNNTAWLSCYGIPPADGHPGDVIQVQEKD